MYPTCVGYKLGHASVAGTRVQVCSMRTYASIGPRVVCPAVLVDLTRSHRVKKTVEYLLKSKGVTAMPSEAKTEAVK